jgi:hypothetical protein
MRHPSVSVVALAVLIVLGVRMPADAIMGGVPDGNLHAYAGAVDTTPLGGRNNIASGVLISPTVYLTVAHLTQHFDRAGLTRARVTFDPIVSSSSTWYTGTVHTNPAYDPSITAVSNHGDPGDLAVIVFDAPVPGIIPAALPTEGLLDRLGPQGLTGASFDVVGYGVSGYVGGSNGGGSQNPDFASTGTRRLAHESFASLAPAWLRLRMDGSADTCNGDSGAPTIFRSSNVVAGITAIAWSISGGQCESGPWDQRMDTPSARAFLGQYVALP